MFFQDWHSIVRILVVGTAAYVGLVALLRISGNRTLSKLNAFDLIVTVALGSTLATVLLSKTTPLLNGLIALALLIFLQYAVTWSSVRVAFVRKLVKSSPVLLMHDGRFIESALRKARVTRVEALAALRSSGVSATDEVGAVILETDGTLSVLQRTAKPVDVLQPAPRGDRLAPDAVRSRSYDP